MNIDEFDKIFFNAVQEIYSEPAEAIMERYGEGPASIEEVFKLAVWESEDFAQKLVYRILAEILVDE